MKPGDLVRFKERYADRIDEVGIIIEIIVHKIAKCPIIFILWQDGRMLEVFEETLELIQ